MSRQLARLAVLGGALMLGACADKPPVPDWQVNTFGSVQRASDAYLSGRSRVADQEWRAARSEAARTGRPDVLAKVELNRCAAQAASAEVLDCPAFEALRADVQPAELLAYADYLAGRGLTAQQVALLPEAQRKAAMNVGAIAEIADPLSLLVASGAALRAGRATPETLVKAGDVASAQGWSRALLGWLSLRAERARTLGDEALEASIKRRMALVQTQGQPVQAGDMKGDGSAKNEKAPEKRP